MNISIINAKDEHIKYLAENMRDIDKKEILAANGGGDVETILKNSLDGTYKNLGWVALINDMPELIWGVGMGSPWIGSPWMLATDKINKVTTKFLRESRYYIEKMQEPFSLLMNYVHSENIISLKWLDWCGFKIDSKITMLNGEPFKLFWRIKNV